MRPILSRDQIRQFDRHATESCSVPSIVLMENAGRGAAEAIHAQAASTGSASLPRVLVVCGLGNNGGDGFVVARQLLRKGYPVDVVLLGSLSDLSGDAAVNCQAWRGLGGNMAEVTDEVCAELKSRLKSAGLVVDAIFGTGLSRDAAGRFRAAIELLNSAGVPCYSLDIPSGLDAETGAVLGACVCARSTLTFAHLKLGLMTNTGAAHAGDVHVIDIGVPARLFRKSGQSAEQTERGDVRQMLSSRGSPAHKGQAGHVAVIAGSPGTIGAAQLVARGAFRTGAGLVTVASFPEAISRLESEAWETMTYTISVEDPAASVAPVLNSADVVAVGPGLGLGSLPAKLTEYVVQNFAGALVLDADGLSHFAGRAGRLASARGHLVLTPHPGEAARLLGSSPQLVEKDRFGAARALVALTHAVVLLKGVRTIIAAPEADPVVNDTGTAALATAGSGDVLAGIISALCCQMPPRQAAICGAWLHGSVAEAWTRQHGAERGMLAREIADGVPSAVAALDGNLGRHTPSEPSSPS